jgi:hypothetical protein
VNNESLGLISGEALLAEFEKELLVQQAQLAAASGTTTATAATAGSPKQLLAKNCVIA